MEIGSGSMPAERGKTSGNLEKLLKTVALEGKLSGFVSQQLEWLNATTSFVADEERAVGYAQQIFSAYPTCFSEEDKSAILQGTVLSDIGKAGSPRMTVDERKLVLAMYGVENVPDGHKLTVAAFLRGAYCERLGLSSGDGERSVQVFRAMLERLNTFSSTDPEKVGMPEFWSRGHLIWTVESMDGCLVPLTSRCSAGLHHRLEGVDPFGGAEPVSLTAALVAVLDKYQAFIERSKFGHEKAVDILKGMVGRATVNSSEKEHYLQAIEMLAVLG